MAVLSLSPHLDTALDEAGVHSVLGPTPNPSTTPILTKAWSHSPFISDLGSLHNPQWKLASEEMHFTKGKIESYQISHLETLLVSHSNIKLAFHNARVSVGSNTRQLSLGMHGNQPGSSKNTLMLAFHSHKP